MVGYKLFRVRKDGSLGSLFINRRKRLPINKWIDAEEHPTEGYKFRPYWHCLSKPDAPHLSMKDRKWFKVELESVKVLVRPKNQGGTWLLADKIKILNFE